MTPPTKAPDAKEILEQIHERAQAVWKSKDNPETLSKVLVELAGLNWGLGEYLVLADEAERELKTELDYEKAKILDQLTKSGESVAKAEIQATLSSRDKRREYNAVAHGKELYKLRRKDTEKLMDAIRSRLSLIKEDIKHDS